ncbi:uncharacterized protein CDAR_287841 [Caerostris darwini]|uniref:WAP domain-containing protein n=1 Tax=Caerostris darwini TaxID=1538125 RepID=A0AAV4P9K0_9ARAC|nr:uncharacterized protein CDAR_287841 [Caerostris darwini]
MEIVLLVFIFLCAGGCNAGVVSRHFKQNELTHSHQISNNTEEDVTENSSVDSQSKILNDALLNVENGTSSEPSVSIDKNITGFIPNCLSGNIEGKATCKLVLEKESTVIINETLDNKIELETESTILVNENHDVELNLEKESTTLVDGNFSDKQGPEKDLEILNIFNKEQNSTMLPTNASNRSIEDIETLHLDQKDNSSIENNSDIIIDEFSANSKKISKDLENTSHNNDSINHNESPMENSELKNNSVPFATQTNTSDLQNGSEDLTKNIKTNGETSETEQLNNFENPIDATDSILFGFGTLINSEITKNAARALEAINFSDLLTNHLIEENEIHNVLTTFTPELDTSISEHFEKENEGMKATEIETFGSLNVAETRPFDKLNISEVLTLIEPKNVSGHEENHRTGDALESENGTAATVIISDTSNTSQSEIGVAGLCPPPGWCIFWLWSQDTCAENSHCLGSRICCRIRCSKTCIDLEALQKH